MGNFFGCPCKPLPVWIPAPPSHPPPPPPSPPSSPSPPQLPPLESIWYCLGVVDSWTCGSALGSCVHDFSLGARNMTTGTVATTGHTGVGHSDQDLCGATIGGFTVNCKENSDITQSCAGYGIAKYNDRTCRTQCGPSGDSSFCFPALNDIFFGTSLGAVLICDRHA
jgi:hypothetical protein